MSCKFIRHANSLHIECNSNTHPTRPFCHTGRPAHLQICKLAPGVSFTLAYVPTCTCSTFFVFYSREGVYGSSSSSGSGSGSSSSSSIGSRNTSNSSNSSSSSRSSSCCRNCCSRSIKKFTVVFVVVFLMAAVVVVVVAVVVVAVVRFELLPHIPVYPLVSLL